MIVGITKARNEEHIIKDTLDNWAQFCDQIFVYDDCSQDDTANPAAHHPAVVDVIGNGVFDEDRLRAEWVNRKAVLDLAKELEPEWIACFDCDEHLHDLDTSLLSGSANIIKTQWYDIYITPEDEHLPDEQYQDRRWVGCEYRQIPFFYRYHTSLDFSLPDQRIMHHPKCDQSQIIQNGLIKHWGKGFSKAIWDRKVQYYGWEQHLDGKPGIYSKKWQARKGKAVHNYFSDDGNPLVLWDDIRQRYLDEHNGISAVLQTA